MKLIKESLTLDWDLLFKVEISIGRKLELILKKYFFLLLSFFGYIPRRGHFLGKSFSFTNKYGYISLERIYVDSDYLAKYIPPGLKILDIGAHIGEFAFFCKERLGASEVVCVEPFEESFNVLKQNTRDINLNYAVSSNNLNEMYLSEISTQLNSLLPDASRHQTRKVPIKSISLDTLLSRKLDKRKFDMLKVDTEGSELDVFESGKESLLKFKYILVEVAIGSENLLGLIEIINKAGNYKLLTISDFRQGKRSVDMLFMAG